MRKAFTLVELLIVIIIIGILATMAVPQYQKMVNRSKWAEAIQLAGAIKTAENLYYAEYNDYSTANLTALPGLALPTNRKFNFSVKTSGMIYGWSNTTSPVVADDGTVPANYYSVNLTANTTGYGGNAPGEL